MLDRPVVQPKRKRLLRIFLFVAAALLVVYSLVGFWILPRILQARLPGLVAAQLPVKLSLGAIRLNPFLLTATVRDLNVTQTDGNHLVGVKQVFGNLQLSSIFRGAVVLKELRITGPDALLQVLPDGRINVLTILPQPDSAPEADAGKPLQIPIVEVDRFVLEEGKVVFRDLSAKAPFEATFSPIQVGLLDFTTRVDAESRFSFSAATDRGGKVDGEGDLMVQPIAARGSVSAAGIDVRRLWQAIQSRVNFEIADGRLDVAGSFAVGIETAGLRLQLTDGRVDLKQFSLIEKGGSTPLVSVPSLSVTGAGLDLNQQSVRVESVQIGDARIQTTVSPDGSIQLLDALLPATSSSGETPATPAPEKSSTVSIDEWDLQVGRIAVKNAGIELQDRGLSPPVPLAFRPINLSVKDLNNRDKETATIALDVRDDFGGRFDITGQVGVNPVTADLQVRVSKAAAKKLEPYVKAVAAVDIVSGAASIDGRLRFDAAGSEPKLRFQGGLRIDDMAVFTPADQRDLVKFTSLAVNGVQVDLEPNQLQVSEIVMDGLKGNLVVEPDGSLNVNRVVASVEKEAADISGSLPARVVRTIKENIRGPFPVQVDAMRVTQAAANFEDRSVKPNFAMTLEKMEGEMTDLSTVRRTPVKVKISGRIDASAPLQVSGSLVPFGEKTDMDMKVSLKYFRLRSISPYAGKHVGYTIKRGQLSLALDYRLSKDIIDGKNKITMRQLTLGEKTDSPDAISLPLDLAVALLKDADGNIHFDVPIKGDINDPQFSVGNVFADTLIKFVTGIVSSPFAVMEGLAGAFSTKDMNRVLFAPGSSAIAADQVDKLKAVAKALRERPALIVSIEGRAYSRVDGKAMASEKSETASPEASGVDQQKLEELARQRAESIRNALVMEGKIESERVEMVREIVEKDSTDGKADAFLSLTAE